jgi:hypothetical protein
MPDEKLVNWINVELSKGMTLEKIKQDLLAQGWPNADIDEAVNSIKTKSNSSSNEIYTPNPSSVVKEEPKKKKPIFTFIIVGLLVIAIGVLIFVIIRNNSSQINTPSVNTSIENTNTPIINSTGNLTFIETSENTSKPLVNGVIECGTNFNCFIDSSQNCNLSNVTHAVLFDFSGINISTIDYYEIKGLSADKCVFYDKIKEINVTAPQENETIAKLRATEKTSEGKEGTCKFSMDDLHAMLIRWNLGNYSSDDYNNANCTGTLFETNSTLS